MNTHELAVKLKTEHDAVEALSDRLREWVAVVPRANIGDWIAELRSRFEHLRAHLIKHMALEEHEGYMKTVVEMRPTLSPEVERLQHEHEEIGKIMTSVHEAVESLEPADRLLVRDCCRRIDNLLHYIEHHENDENLLLLTSMTSDIGAND